MKFCKNCGAQLEDGVLFCEECGTSTQKKTQQTSAETHSAPTANAEPTPASKSGGNKKTAQLAIPAIIVLCIIAGVIILLGKSGKKNSAEPAADSISAQAPDDSQQADLPPADAAQTTPQPTDLPPADTAQSSPASTLPSIKTGTYFPNDDAYRYSDTIEISYVENNTVYLHITTVWHDFIADAYITGELQPAIMQQTQYMLESDYFDSWGNENHLQVHFDCDNDALIVNVSSIDSNPDAGADAGNSATYYFASEDVLESKSRYEDDLYISYRDDPAYNGSYDGPFGGFDDPYGGYGDPYTEPAPTASAPAAPTLSSKFTKNYDTAIYDPATGLWVIGNTTVNGNPVKLSGIAHLSMEDGYISFLGCVQNISSLRLYNLYLNVYLVSETGQIIDRWECGSIINPRPDVNFSIISEGELPKTADNSFEAGSKLIVATDPLGYIRNFLPYEPDDINEPANAFPSFHEEEPSFFYTHNAYFLPGEEAWFSWDPNYSRICYRAGGKERYADCWPISLRANYSTPIYGIYVTLNYYTAR